MALLPRTRSGVRGGGGGPAAGTAARAGRELALSPGPGGVCGSADRPEPESGGPLAAEPGQGRALPPQADRAATFPSGGLGGGGKRGFPGEAHAEPARRTLHENACRISCHADAPRVHFGKEARRQPPATCLP